MNRNRQEFAGRLGDLPEDYARPPSNPSTQVNGLDTTGTRRSVAQQLSISTQSVLNSLAGTPLAPFAMLFQAFLDAINQKAAFSSATFTATNAGAFQARPQENRNYLIIQNNDAAVIYVGIGYIPTPATGIQIPANGNYEPLKVPQDAIFILGSAAAQKGVLLYANG